MKHAIVFLFLLAGILISGCSDDKKEEAARLEQELMGGDTTTEEAVEQESAPDTLAPERKLPTRSPGAIPSESSFDLPEKPAGSGYAVQVAGCEDPKYATYLVGVYTNRGYEPYVTQATVGGQVYYRVRIGLFASMTEARSLSAELQDKFSISPWIDFVS